MATKKKETTIEKYPGAAHSTGLLQDAPGKKSMDSPPVLPVMKGKTGAEYIHNRCVHQVGPDIQTGARGIIPGVGETTYDATLKVPDEEKFRDAENYLNTVIYYAGTPTIVWDPLLRITLFNAWISPTGKRRNLNSGCRLLNMKKQMRCSKKRSGRKNYQIPILRTPCPSSMHLLNRQQMVSL